MTHDDSLRSDRLVYYADDVDRLDSELDQFLELSKARTAMLVDKEGHLVTHRGEPLKTSMESIAALIAGSFAATKEMARLLGETAFSILFHQGARDSIQLQLIGNRTLLAILFDGRTNLGMVRFYAQEAAQRLETVLTSISEAGRDADLSEEFGVGAADALDEIL
jgi:predicted regulator of Ras-like GTPase activity (Roadblock/LC7/MglB family)